MSFIFTSANDNIVNGSINLFNGQFDLYLVTAVPVISSTIVSDLTLVALSTPVLLTNNSTSTKWNFNDITLPNFNYSVSPIGFVISKRLGANSSNTDPVIYYSELTNSLGQLVTYNTGVYRVNINFVSTGLISFDSVFEYFSGAYVNNEPVPKGLIYLLGTNNNTTSFVNPVPSKIDIYYRTSDENYSGYNSSGQTNRSIAGDVTCRYIMMNFSKLIRVGTVGVFVGSSSGSILSLYGSNTLSTFDFSNFVNEQLWTLLGSLNSPTSNTCNFITSTNPVYWKYLKFEINSATDLQFNEIEFYNSSILSTTLNMV